MKLVQFGEQVEGYEIPVLNEREIRAAAGILFLTMFLAIVQVVFRWNFTPLKFATTVFLIDILIRVFVSPRFAPTLILGRLIVRNQTPEYVGAQQKKFAWLIGIGLATPMFISLVLLNTHGPINGLICMICLVFLFCETAFGICLGCKVYPLFYGKRARYCPGEVCDTKARQAIQKTSATQLVAFFAVVGVVVASGYLFSAHFAREPVLVMGMQKPVH